MQNLALTRLVVITTSLSLFAVFGASAEDETAAAAEPVVSNAFAASTARARREERATIQNAERVPIPDQGAAAVTSALEVQGLREYHEAVMLRLSLHHPRPADLEVVLRNPAGTEVVVWNRNRAMADAVLDFPVEGFMPNDVVNGIWTVSVIDHVRGATGTLESWVLTVASHD